MAALQLRRSVRVVLTRQQMFTFGYRPRTLQRLQLGADAEGRLLALGHQATAQTSRFEDFTEHVVEWSGMLYRCENLSWPTVWCRWTSIPRWTCAPPARRWD